MLRRIGGNSEKSSTPAEARNALISFRNLDCLVLENVRSELELLLELVCFFEFRELLLLLPRDPKRDLRCL